MRDLEAPTVVKFDFVCNHRFGLRISLALASMPKTKSKMTDVEACGICNFQFKLERKRRVDLRLLGLARVIRELKSLAVR